MEEVMVTLATIANGAALELFERELSRVIENIADVNTDWKAKREIHLKVTIMPDEGRGLAVTALQVTSKLAGVKPVATVVYFGRKDGQPVAVTHDFAQPNMFEDRRSTVVPLHAVTGNGGAA